MCDSDSSDKDLEEALKFALNRIKEENPQDSIYTIGPEENPVKHVAAKLEVIEYAKQYLRDHGYSEGFIDTVQISITWNTKKDE
jgi:hypothetical protein